MSLLTSVPVFRVSDYPRARAFWEGVLGFEVTQEAGDPVTGFGIYRSGKALVFLTAWDGPEAAYEGWRAYFHTDDLEPIMERLRQAGVDFKGPVFTEYGMGEVSVQDPDGNWVCFGQEVT